MNFQQERKSELCEGKRADVGSRKVRAWTLLLLLLSLSAMSQYTSIGVSAQHHFMNFNAFRCILNQKKLHILKETKRKIQQK